jgi:putative transposase
MCIWSEVSRSGYYEWSTRPMSATATRHEELKVAIAAVFEANHGIYGYRRIHAVLLRSEYEVSDELVRQLMRELGLVACQPRPWRPATTLADEQQAKIPDLVNRNFTADAPGEKLVGDITYIPTDEGFLYLATVIDCYSKMIIGWAMDDNYKTPLITAAIDAASKTVALQEDCIFHSDRGSNYTSYEFGKELKERGMRRSTGRTGICYDNAMAESFFGSLKNEWLSRTKFSTRDEARQAVFWYIETFYNRRRLHSALGYQAPAEVHDLFMQMRFAA